MKYRGAILCQQLIEKGASTILEKKHTHQQVKRTRYWTLLLLLTLALTFYSGPTGTAVSPLVHAEAATLKEQIVLYVDGKRVEWSTSPFIKQGVTYVPARDFVSSIGAGLEWNTNTKVVTIRQGNTTISHQVGSKHLIRDHSKVKMSASSQIVGNTTFLPFRDLSSALDASFDLWMTSEQTLINMTLKGEQDNNLRTDMQRIDTYLKEKRFVGNALIAQKGEILLECGYGPAGSGRLNEPHLKSRVASISKQFTAAAIMKLVEEGKLHLDDPLQKFVPDVPRASEITLHMLLTHTSGLPSDIPRVEGASLAETVAEVKKMNILFEPGTDYRYSNPGYVLLAYIIQESSGMSYGEYVKKHFLDPLAMSDTGEATPQTDTVKGHFLSNGRLTETEYYVSQSGTGSLYSTVYDLLKWDQALYTEQILTQASIEKMFIPNPYKNYGYGWEIKEGSGGRVVSTTGGGKGYTTSIVRDLSNETVVILLSNQEKVEIQQIQADINALMLP